MHTLKAIYSSSYMSVRIPLRLVPCHAAPTAVGSASTAFCPTVCSLLDLEQRPFMGRETLFVGSGPEIGGNTVTSFPLRKVG